MELTIEISGRGNRHLELHRVSGEQVTIGRAFDNDVVLSDPHVCAHHAVIEKSDNGTPALRDLGSVNGTFTGRHKAVEGHHAVTSGDEFILGKTHIRIYQQNHPVPPGIRLTWVENLALAADTPVIAGGLFLIALSIGLFLQYSAAVKEFHISRELFTAAGVLLLSFIWPVCWSIFARIRKHDARFLAHLSATIAFLITVTLVQRGYAWLAFHTGAGPGLAVLRYGAYILLALMLVWFNYYLAIFLSAKRRWVYAISLTGLLTGFAYAAASFDEDRFKYRPEYHAVLYPPSLSLYSTRSVEAYLKEAEKIFEIARKSVDDKD